MDRTTCAAESTGSSPRVEAIGGSGKASKKNYVTVSADTDSELTFIAMMKYEIVIKRGVAADEQGSVVSENAVFGERELNSFREGDLSLPSRGKHIHRLIAKNPRGLV
jgi:hypothetical protein